MVHTYQVAINRSIIISAIFFICFFIVFFIYLPGVSLFQVSFTEVIDARLSIALFFFLFFTLFRGQKCVSLPALAAFFCFSSVLLDENTEKIAALYRIKCQNGEEKR